MYQLCEGIVTQACRKDTTDSSLAKTAIPPKKLEEAWRCVNERVAHTDPVVRMIRNNQLEKMLDWATNHSGGSPAFGFRVTGPASFKPVFDKRLNVTREFVEGPRTG
jgi:hypothetical protein